ncbi:hypothetical protein Glove_139g11 [Diversispora epigaea]|uniref:Uncharacterized protein n=1 Tax=Diversispora epigaea TaxID=1348612 RepID=A0A397IVV8_9GLOM|nr:hypothetical protein Glove_139g11 [Diversispora epigaea]
MSSQISFVSPLTPNNFISLDNSPTSPPKKIKKIVKKQTNNNTINVKDFNSSKLEINDNFPKINAIRYQGNRKHQFQYNILKLGNYPSNVRRTQRSGHKIPNGYQVQVLIYERNVICSTNYEFNGKVKFQVTWEENNEKKYSINSLKSSSDAAKLFLKKISSKNNTNLSGVVLFGLDLECLELRREDKENIPPKRKLFSNLKSGSQKNKRLKELASKINSNSKDLFTSYNFSDTSLDCLKLNIQGQFINLKFSNSYNESTYFDSILCACDETLISRDGYRKLAAVQPSMKREYLIAARKKEINNIMENKIPIKNFNINPTNELLVENICSDENSEEVFINKAQIGNGATRSLIGLLITLLPDLTEGDNPILHKDDVIKIKLGGDGRQVGRYNHHVMLTACILNEKNKVLSPKHQYCICLYPGIEKYESLTIAHQQIIEELIILHNEGLKDNNNVYWKVEFWFTADWKYMALILGINGPTSNYFCLWCECHKNERWNIDKNWSNAENTKGKIRANLLPFLTSKYCVPDELHLMLRIVDVLLDLFFMELMRDPSAFDKILPCETMSIREKIELKMQEIGVTSFKFIPPEKKTKYSKWSWCTLMGPAKLKIIEKFPLSTFINGQRGKDIEKLCENLTIEDITQFSYDVRKWVQEFARPLKKTVNGQIEQEGLYQRTDVTPYMHVRLFFGGTTMGGGTEKEKQSAAYQISSFENRQIYFRINKTSTMYSEKALMIKC